MVRELAVNYENKFCYNIIFRFNWDDLLACLNTIYPDKSPKIAIVTDSNVSKLYLRQVREVLLEKFNDVITFELPAGEINKTLYNIEKLYEVLISKNFHRDDLLIALGGGVIGDMTGFAASTFLRGIDFIQIPTTLLSQVDSSIGGKTGVDFKEYKNMIGAFYMPKLVYMNTSLLKTLPDEQFSSGMAEVIKHGIIRNHDYYNWIRDNKDAILNKEDEFLARMVYESCLVKKAVVEEDPKETGLRGILNFGHTVGHAIEKASDFRLFHGQCVALGSVAAARISCRLGLISDDDVESIIDVFSLFGLPVSLSGIQGIDAGEVLENIRSDKKMTSSGLKFILLNSIGDAFIRKGIAEDIIVDSIEGLSVGC